MSLLFACHQFEYRNVVGVQEHTLIYSLYQIRTGALGSFITMCFTQATTKRSGFA